MTQQETSYILHAVLTQVVGGADGSTSTMIFIRGSVYVRKKWDRSKKVGVLGHKASQTLVRKVGP